MTPAVTAMALIKFASVEISIGVDYREPDIPEQCELGRVGTIGLIIGILDAKS
jgi:hypothetical protein